MNLLIVEKYSDSSYIWHNLERKLKVSGSSVTQIANRYQGFEGDFIRAFPIAETKQAEHFLKERNNLSFLLCVLSPEELLPTSLESKFSFAGYDIGVCEEDKMIYSSIFNEILFGNVSELISQLKNLNRNLLFQDLETAEKYVLLHEDLANKEKDVESYETFSIYGVWKYKES